MTQLYHPAGSLAHEINISLTHAGLGVRDGRRSPREPSLPHPSPGPPSMLTILIWAIVLIFWKLNSDTSEHLLCRQCEFNHTLGSCGYLLGVLTSLQSGWRQTSVYCVQGSACDTTMKLGGCMVRQIGSKALGSNLLLTVLAMWSRAMAEPL